MIACKKKNLNYLIFFKYNFEYEFCKKRYKHKTGKAGDEPDAASLNTSENISNKALRDEDGDKEINFVN